MPSSPAPVAPPLESAALVRRFPRYPDTFTYEPSSRWVRGVLDGVTVVDSRHQILVWEPGHKVPEYGFPRDHVRLDLLEAGAAPEAGYYRPQTKDVEWYDLVVGEHRVRGAAWKWNTPGLEDYVAVSWFPGVLDAWYEEDELVITHPRDPGNRVDVIPSSRHVVVRAGDRVLAESRRPLALFENRLPTRFYLPAEDVHWDHLERVEVVSTCPYKGTADGYWALKGAPDREVAWAYSKPFHQVSAIKDHVAFYNERVELVVDGAPFLDSPETWA
ncbi:DUF427 domain-containing protein [Nocardioides sp. CER19]|uniref:DUF427 domain-containing protein n=1 Tax=Nocardioides sp. CER19 TaxID=3038538 RepID=UPI0024489F48|nr:DUF427 domain-containing protein [Nocardioides sp. CER19]MDH2416294.1 DUF427 domain-containing protein [Nocardioides sp. CER19]